MKIRFVIVSKDNSFKMGQDKFVDANLEDTTNLTYIPNNRDPLPIVYNKILREERASHEDDYVVFMHSDVSFNIRLFVEHLKSLENKYALIGLCGTSILNVSQSPLNWWTGSNPTPFAKWGCVTHGELGD